MRRVFIISASLHVILIALLPVLPNLGVRQPLAMQVYAVELVDLPPVEAPVEEVQEETVPEPEPTPVEAPPEEEPIPENPVKRPVRKPVPLPPKREEKSLEERVSVNELFSEPVLTQLLLLEPHGVGNPQPVFRDPSVSFKDIRRIGKDKSHLRLTINNGTSVISGIGFGLGEISERCANADDKGILYSPSLNFFRGRRSWQARVIDVLFDND